MSNNKTVLLFEDYERVQDVFVKSLTAAGYNRVVTFTTSLMFPAITDGVLQCSPPVDLTSVAFAIVAGGEHMTGVDVARRLSEAGVKCIGVSITPGVIKKFQALGVEAMDKFDLLAQIDNGKFVVNS